MHWDHRRWEDVHRETDVFAGEKYCYVGYVIWKDFVLLMTKKFVHTRGHVAMYGV